MNIKSVFINNGARYVFRNKPVVLTRGPFLLKPPKANYFLTERLRTQWLHQPSSLYPHMYFSTLSSQWGYSVICEKYKPKNGCWVNYKLFDANNLDKRLN